MNYFFDTNILLDFFISNRENHNDVIFLFDELRNRDNEYEFWIDRDSISTINYILRKENFRNDITGQMISNFSITGETSILLEANEYTIKNGVDYEDVVKVLSAQKIEAVLFLTHDQELLSRNDDFNIQIMSIFEILRKMGFQKTLLGDWIKSEDSEDTEIENLSIMSLVYEINKINQLSREEYTDEIRLRNNKLISKLDEYTKKLKDSK